MGGSGSKWQEPVARLTASAPIPADDQYWDQELLNLRVPAAAASADLSASVYAFCAELLLNNSRTGNFQSLVLRLLAKTAAARRRRPSATVLQQAAGCVFLVRLFLRHMVETLEPEELLPHLQLRPSALEAVAAAVPPGGAPLVASAELSLPLVDALLATLADAPLDDPASSYAEAYALHTECLAAVAVCMSTQIFCELGSTAPQPMALAALASDTLRAERLTLRLLGHVAAAPPPPGAPSLVRRAVGAALYLPWAVLSYFWRGEGGDGRPPPALADRSLHALLLLTQSLPPPLARHLPHGNPFLAALCAVGDAQSASSADAADDDDAEGGGAADPEQGRVRASQLAFRSLHDAIAAALPAEGAVLLLYLLLHGNADFRDYALSRTDADTLLLPLVRALYEPRSLRPNALYMLLIVVLMLSQDGTHCAIRAQFWRSSVAIRALRAQFF